MCILVVLVCWVFFFVWLVGWFGDFLVGWVVFFSKSLLHIKKENKNIEVYLTTAVKFWYPVPP